jgi:DNA-binding IclR family transcriptional regulator
MTTGNLMSTAESNTGLETLERHQSDAPVIATSSGTGTLGKAIEVLDIIASSDSPLRFTDVLNRIDQPRGTLHRQISNLIEEGLLSHNPDGSYALGLRLLKLAARAWSQNSFRSIAEPHIRALHGATGETVHLGLMSGLEVIYLDKIESNQTVRMHSQVGNASPLYCTGVGKAMLATLPEVEAARLAEQFAYKQHTPSTLATPDKLLRELQNIRRTGISHDREEHEPGIYCVASAIEIHGTGQVGGLSVTAPAYRITKKTIAQWETLVAETAKRIEQDIRIGLGPRSQD